MFDLMKVGAVLVLALVAACSNGPRAVRQRQIQEAELARQEASDDEPYQVSASHILISYAGASRVDPDVQRTKEEARVLAEQVLKRVQGGEDFATVAKEMSDGPSAPQGGSLGMFTRSKMTPAFSEAAFSVPPNTIYDGVVETEFGFHIIRRDG